MLSPWTRRFMLATLALYLVAITLHHRRERPRIMKARAAQWALTSSHMLEQLRTKEGDYPSCGPGRRSCRELLGWMNRPDHLEGYTLTVKGGRGHWGLRVQGAQGRWVLERGQALRWEAGQQSGQAHSGASRPPP